LIVLGHLLRRKGIPSFEFWNLNDKLVYWVLFPSFLFHKMATMEISGEFITEFAFAIYTGLFAAIAFALLMGKLCKLQSPIWTSVLQGSARHNTFIALAVAERVFGVEGAALAALITALLIPLTNISVVTLMVVMLRDRNGVGVFRAVARDLIRNPLLVAVLLGAAFKAYR